MTDIHPVFHVSQLRRCLRVPEGEHVPVETIDLQPDLRYQEVPVKILDTVTRRTRNSEVRICRVQWSRHGVEEADEDINYNTSTSTPAAPFPATPDAPPPQAPPPFGPITRARARELNFVMLLKNEGPEE
jgi:hypothetical protein